MVQVDVVSATRNIASRFQSVPELDLLNQSLNAIINRLGRSKDHFFLALQVLMGSQYFTEIGCPTILKLFFHAKFLMLWNVLF